ncbi:MAG: hypothetical protein K9L31_01320 [Candidatus Pacebacteria bacterium]|nr:hypothetical protein [Candidatus Paceibacterota bacterium]
MKKNITILLGAIAVIAVFYVGQTLSNDRKQADVSDIVNEIAMKQFTGQVVRSFEGEHVLDYSLEIPETASTSVDMYGALIRITDDSKPLATMYISYEGARGYSPADYINNIVAPHVAVIDITSTSSIGSYEWQEAESAGSEWYIAPVMDGEWLIVVENKKTAHDSVMNILNSIMVN